MTRFMTGCFPDLATYWPVGSNSDTGGQDYSAITPVVINCRWEDKQILFRDANGREAVSDAVIYPETTLAVRGHIVQGDVGAVLGDNPQAFDAKEIRAQNLSRSISGDQDFQKIMV